MALPGEKASTWSGQDHLPVALEPTTWSMLVGGLSPLERGRLQQAGGGSHAFVSPYWQGQCWEAKPPSLPNPPPQQAPFCVAAGRQGFLPNGLNWHVEMERVPWPTPKGGRSVGTRAGASYFRSSSAERPARNTAQPCPHQQVPCPAPNVLGWLLFVTQRLHRAIHGHNRKQFPALALPPTGCQVLDKTQK